MKLMAVATAMRRKFILKGDMRLDMVVLSIELKVSMAALTAAAMPPPDRPVVSA
jgi:hypothetical protein